MQVESATMKMEFSMREMQSLLMLLRRMQASRGGTMRISNLPAGVTSDLQMMAQEFEQALLMDERYGR
jgi:hypothetical protein